MNDNDAERTRRKSKWGHGYGTVDERFTENVSLTIKGTEVSQEATKDSPAYLIVQDGGGQVLKSHSEIQRDS